MFVPFSAFPETQWPAVPSTYAGGLLGILLQLEHTQWWSATQIAEQQSHQLQIVLNHARDSVPFYRDRIVSWNDIPLLTRRDVQLAGPSLHSSKVPVDHGRVRTSVTGGSTGQPVRVLSTDFTDLMWSVLTLRDHLWHRRDFSQSFAAIRYTKEELGSPPEGSTLETWGRSTKNIVPTGRAHLLNVQSTIREQADWLHRVNAGYVMAYPSALAGVARIFETGDRRLPGLHQVLTYGEVLEPANRRFIERAFAAPVCDMYSSQEVGYMALQCPDSDGYHVQSESVLVEVLTDTGRACKPGEVGKVVVTTLHNFAMPLLRYDIGDYAEVGECKCGRGLPVLKRILGRQRNLLTLPNGEKKWPVFASAHGSDDLPSFFQFQVVQGSLDSLDVNLVRPNGNLTPDEMSAVERHFHRLLGYPFRIRIYCVEEIPRSLTGKYEDFISLVE
jgi:phenylacetate-CoA ligase